MAQELKEKSVDELKNHLLDLYHEQVNLRMQKGMGEAPRTHRFKQVRKDIARVKTILNERAKT